MSEEASRSVIETMGGDEDSAQLSQQSVASSEGDAQQLGAQAESAEQENAHAEPPELPDEPAERQTAQQVQEEKFPVGRFQQYCDAKQVNLKTRMLAGSQICKLKADKNGFNDGSNDSVDIYYDSALEKHGIIVTNRNACRNWAAAQDQGCTRRDKCRFYHFAPGDLVDNFIGKEPRKIADIPVLLAGDAKAREYRWSKEDEGKIKAKQTELLEALTTATKQRKIRTQAKTFQQMQEEAIAAAEASDSSSADEASDSSSDPPTPPPKKKRKADRDQPRPKLKKKRKTDRKARDGKKASKAKK